MPVQFFFLLKNINLTNRGKLKKFLENLFKQEGKQLSSLTYIFCSDKYILDINKKHLGHDFYTDIVTFDLSSGSGPTQGEIYISSDRVRENAQKFAISINEELHRVIFHGALHLCGFKDKTKAQVNEIRQAEDHYLNQYGFKIQSH